MTPTPSQTTDNLLREYRFFDGRIKQGHTIRAIKERISSWEEEIERLQYLGRVTSTRDNHFLTHEIIIERISLLSKQIERLKEAVK